MANVTDPLVNAPSGRRWRQATVEFGLAISAGLLALAGAILVWDPLPILAVPWGRFDLLVEYGFAKDLLEHNWPFTNPSLGYPFVQDFAHFPVPYVSQFILLWLLAKLTSNAIVADNLLLLSSFFTVAAVSYVAMRVLGISRFLGLAIAVAFSLLPWHLRTYVHLTLSNYYSVPAGLILIWVVTQGAIPATAKRMSSSRVLLLVLLGVFIGVSGAYYSAFTSIIALSVIVGQLIAGRPWRNSIWSAVIAAIPAVTTAAAAAAMKLLAVTPGGTDAYARHPEESQSFGGAIFTLFRVTNAWSQSLPLPGSNVNLVVGTPIETDAANGTVGVVAVYVTTAAVAAIVVGGPWLKARAWPRVVGALPGAFLIAVLFFAIGGFGQLFSQAFGYQLRSWGRLSLFIILIALATFGLLVDHWSSRRGGWLLRGAAAVVILAATLADSLTGRGAAALQAANIPDAELSQYGQAVSRELGSPTCPILSWPRSSFPEGWGEPLAPLVYDSLLPYLYTPDSTWSYGAIRGTQAGDWVYDTLSSDPSVLVRQAKAAGFCALQLDTSPFEDADEYAEPIVDLLGAPIVSSSTGRWRLYDLRNVDQAPFTEAIVGQSVVVSPGAGLGDLQAGAWTRQWPITGDEFALTVTNDSGNPIEGTLQFAVASGACTATVVPAAADTSPKTVVPARTFGLVTQAVALQTGEGDEFHYRIDQECSPLAGDVETAAVADPIFIAAS